MKDFSHDQGSVGPNSVKIVENVLDELEAQEILDANQIPKTFLKENHIIIEQPEDIQAMREAFLDKA